MMASKDVRIKLMNEVLSGIKVCKPSIINRLPEKQLPNHLTIFIQR